MLTSDSESWIASAGQDCCKGSGANIRPQEQKIAIVEVVILEIFHDLRVLSSLENSDLDVESVFVDKCDFLNVISSKSCKDCGVCRDRLCPA